MSFAGFALLALVFCATEDEASRAWLADRRLTADGTRSAWRSKMTQMAVAVMPIADVGAWQAFADEISTGARSDAHRAFLRRGGVRKETLFHQKTPMGDLMVLLWDGVDPDQLAAHFGSMLQNPTSDHERYLRDYVIPKVHGIDTEQPPPPPARQVAEIVT